MCKKIRCIKPKNKRYFLPICLIILLFIIPEVRHNMYLPIIVLISSFVLFWNFPILVIFSTNKPVYLSDLFINTNHEMTELIPVNVKNRTITIYKWILIGSSSVMMSVLSDYWLLQYSDHISLMSTIGITGGVLKIYQLINKIFAQVLLFILRKIMEKQKILYKKHLREKIELIAILNNEFKNICKSCKSSKDILNKLNSVKRKRINSFISINKDIFDLEKGRRYSKI